MTEAKHEATRQIIRNFAADLQGNRQDNAQYRESQKAATERARVKDAKQSIELFDTRRLLSKANQTIKRLERTLAKYATMEMPEPDLSLTELEWPSPVPGVSKPSIDQVLSMERWLQVPLFAEQSTIEPLKICRPSRRVCLVPNSYLK